MMSLERQKLSLKKNDQVQVMAGREKGKVGKILKVDSKNGRVLVEKVNLMKRHTRPTQKNAGGILEKEVALHYSNVLLFCVKCSRGVRHGTSLVEKSEKKGAKSASGSVGKVKVRVCKRCKESLDNA